MQRIRFEKSDDGNTVMFCGVCGNKYHAWSVIATAEYGIHLGCMNCHNVVDATLVVLTAVEAADD